MDASLTGMVRYTPTKSTQIKQASLLVLVAALIGSRS
jgi:hypothetical protein